MKKEAEIIKWFKKGLSHKFTNQIYPKLDRAGQDALNGIKIWLWFGQQFEKVFKPIKYILILVQKSLSQFWF